MSQPSERRFRAARCNGLTATAAALLFVFSPHTLAAAPNEIDALLGAADRIKTADPAEFAATLTRIHSATSLTEGQRNYLHYLKGWQSAYAGDYDAAIPALKSVIDESPDVTLRFRAIATVTNVLVLANRYEDAFIQLRDLLDALPRVDDKPAREQGLGVIAYLYNQVGEYDLGLRYAQALIDENPAALGACRGAQLKLESQYHSAKLRTASPDYQSGVETCVKLGELTYANVIRTYMARLHIDQGRFEEAISLLATHYEEAQKTAYPRLISEYNALFAVAYRETGNSEQVRRYAMAAIETNVKSQYSEPLAYAYRLLYAMSKEQGNSAAALTYHEKYAAADKGYLDDVSARQLAYQRVKHETIANKAQIDTLNSENEVLQLQRVNIRLYMALLVLAAAFIAFFAYKTKRSQLHFKKLSQQDGLTGIANRPHFLKQAEAALTAHRRSGQDVCVVLCDLDHFKAINDRHGHAGGDSVLKQVVAEFRSHLRAGDIFGRVGGEEFGILLPGCSLEAARDRCEQLRLALTALAIQIDQQEIRASASFGVETSASCGYELRQLLANADAALYQAKDAGRDRVVAYDVSMANTFATMTTGRLRASRDRFQQDFAAQTP